MVFFVLFYILFYRRGYNNEGGLAKQAKAFSAKEQPDRAEEGRGECLGSRQLCLLETSQLLSRRGTAGRWGGWYSMQGQGRTRLGPQTRRSALSCPWAEHTGPRRWSQHHDAQMGNPRPASTGLVPGPPRERQCRSPGPPLSTPPARLRPACGEAGPGCTGQAKAKAWQLFPRVTWEVTLPLCPVKDVTAWLS